MVGTKTKLQGAGIMQASSVVSSLNSSYAYTWLTIFVFLQSDIGMYLGSTGATYAPPQLAELFRTLGGPDEAAQRTFRVLPAWKNIHPLYYGRPGNFCFSHVSADIEHLLRGMLALNPHQRLSAREAANHPTFDAVRANPTSAYNRAMNCKVTSGSFQAAAGALKYARSITRELLAEWEARIDTRGQQHWVRVELPACVPEPRILHPMPAKRREMMKPLRFGGMVSLDKPEDRLRAEVSCLPSKLLVNSSCLRL